MASSANKHADKHEHNYTMCQAFEWYTQGEGKHWQWLGDNAKRFADMGITAVWIPPPTKASSASSTGYDIYDTWDLGEFTHPRDEKAGVQPPNRTKYGTREQLEAAVQELRKNGISIYVDAVLNHRMGADELQTFKARMVDQNDRNKFVSDAYDIEGWTKFTFPGRGDKYSSFKWGFEHFAGVDWDQKSETKAIFRIEGDGKHWATDVDKENGNYSFLLGVDIDHEHPDAKKDLLDWGAWMMRNFPIAGFRFDAVKHISRHFIHDFVKHIREEARKLREERGLEPADEAEGPIAFSVGEFWKDSLDSCLKYLTEFGDEQFSLFDAPLHYNFKEAGDGAENYDLRKIFDGSIVQARPIDAVTLVENHDTQKGQALESTVPAQFKPLAYAIILMRVDGYPCVFLGDLDGCNPTGIDNGEGKAEPMADLEKFVKARKYFAYGEQKEYWDHANCIAWVRTGTKADDGSGYDASATIICNGSGQGSKWVEVGKQYVGQNFVDVIGWFQGQSKVNDDGWVEVHCHPRSASIWVPENSKHREFF
ncbi:probable alpha-amylase [Sporisorium reilianum f. sp. reilianum]|uniref:Probable alpha-amylase n=1 Tax=Sporisorium reilianum f. sp. reilianum TaxID=72559 RepID=A0A2N8UMD5_9BASI|nr:probable alpha-amylase [Sporisorium reilianum f. sp. reilianum]